MTLEPAGDTSRFSLATLLVQESIDRIENPATPPAFVGLPTLLIYLYFQEDIVAGIQLSELK